MNPKSLASLCLERYPCTTRVAPRIRYDIVCLSYLPVLMAGGHAVKKPGFFATTEGFVDGFVDFRVTSSNPFYVIGHVILAHYYSLSQEVAKSGKHDYPWISDDCNIIAVYY